MATYKKIISEDDVSSMNNVRPIALAQDGSNRAAATTEISNSLQELQKLHKSEYGGSPLFGKHGLTSPQYSSFRGASAHLMNHGDQPIQDQQLAQLKPTFDSIDTAIHPEHKPSLYELLQRISRPDHTGKKPPIGNYTVDYVKRTRTKIQAVMTHANGNSHMFNFEFTNPDDCWTTDEKKNIFGSNESGKFPSSYPIEDLQSGIPEISKNIMLNSINPMFRFETSGIGGGGLSRADGLKIGSRQKIRFPSSVFKTLFPAANRSESSMIKSSTGISYLVGKYTDENTQQQFIGNVLSQISKLPNVDVKSVEKIIGDSIQSGKSAASNNNNNRQVSESTEQTSTATKRIVKKTIKQKSATIGQATNNREGVVAGVDRITPARVYTPYEKISEKLSEHRIENMCEELQLEKSIREKADKISKYTGIEVPDVVRRLKACMARNARVTPPSVQESEQIVEMAEPMDHKTLLDHLHDVAKNTRHPDAMKHIAGAVDSIEQSNKWFGAAQNTSGSETKKALEGAAHHNRKIANHVKSLVLGGFVDPKHTAVSPYMRG